MYPFLIQDGIYKIVIPKYLTNCSQKLKPDAVNNPSTVIINHKLAKKLGLNLNGISEKELSNLFSGNQLPHGAKPFAQAYAGHQFGQFTILGDGRAHVVGEQMTPEG